MNGIGSPRTDRPFCQIYQKVNRGGGAKPGRDGVPLSKSGRPDAMPPSFMKSCATPDAPGGPAMTVVSRPPFGQLIEDRLRHELNGAFDQDHVVRSRIRAALLHFADRLSDAGDAQFLR